MPVIEPVKQTRRDDDLPVYSVGMTTDGRVTLTIGQYTTMTMEEDACAKLISMLATAMEHSKTDTNKVEND